VKPRGGGFLVQLFHGAFPQRAKRVRKGDTEKGGSDIVNLAGVAVVDAQKQEE
jgi:hypothetical protein